MNRRSVLAMLFGRERVALATSLEAALVRVQNSVGTSVGAGFLISNDTLLTCAHVVSRAIGAEHADPPSHRDHVTVVFPLIDPHARIETTVERWISGGTELQGDIALLRLLSSSSVPVGARPVRLVTSGNLSGVEARVGGFPQGLHNVAWARCTILGHSASGVVQTEDIRMTGVPVQPGFSGGPLWSDVLQAVVGMTLAVTPRLDSRTSYAITGQALLNALPEIHDRVIPPTPYRGLRAFHAEDSHLFFGREALVAELVERAAKRENALLVGPSGCGKTSLLLAGVLPRLRAAHKRNVLVVRPTEAAVRERVDAAIRGADSTLIVVDQAEETVTADAVELVARVTAEASRPSSIVRALVAVRSDFLDTLLSQRELAGLASWHTRSVPAMGDAELRRTIEGPLPSGVVFENGLVERILEAVREAKAPLPLLQFTLSRLWDEQRGGVIGHRAYEEFGGISGALDGYAEEVWALLGPGERAVAPRLFNRLLRVHRGHLPVGRSALLEELSLVSGSWCSFPQWLGWSSSPRTPGVRRRCGSFMRP
nr:trypsin-like peptidase domain-containing protein [Allosalinactinospora lopnorensis]